MTEIKICGITDIAEIDWLNEAHVDYAGFVFYQKSKRYIPIAEAQKIARKLDSEIKKVAVTVSPDPVLAAQIQDAGFHILQIHGEFAEGLEENIQIPIWRAINLSGVEELKRLESSLPPWVSGVLVDAGDFGSGRTFGWDQTAPDITFRGSMAKRGSKFILAGGLDSENVADGIHLFHPDVVDVSSGVSMPGDVRKSRERIFAFCDAARSVE